MSLRGSYQARIDDRNRLKIPAEFRRYIEQSWGSELFVTSLDGQDVRIYPIPVWEEFEQRLLALPLMQPSRLRIQKVVNFFGQEQAIDPQGRVLIHSPIKERAAMSGEVVVMGCGDHLIVQSIERVQADVEQSIEKDLETVSQLWSKP